MRAKELEHKQIMELKNKSVTVMGLGRFGGGVGVARWLAEQGALVTVTDTAKAEELAESVGKLAGLPIRYKLGGHDVADFLPPQCDLLVTNPAVDKAKSEHVQAAIAAGVPLTTEMNLFVERCPARTIGITGSVGKSTTTMLTYLAVRAATAQWPDRPNVYLGGNIGKSLLSELAAMRPQDIVVLELSSFMLEDTPAANSGFGWSPNIALVTNVFPNHLDRHNTMAELSAAKQNIFRFQSPDDILIVNADHELVSRWTHLAKGKTAKFTARGPGKIDLLMPGEHNQANARAAMAVVAALTERFGQPVDRAAALAAMGGFRGLEHRLELVHTATAQGEGGPREVRFYNDSKATTPESAMTALESFAPGTAIFIIGGYDKHADMSTFERMLAQRAAGVLGIGQTGAAMVRDVEELGTWQGRAEYTETLEKAVSRAWEWCGTQREWAGELAVVLSPGCASWGQFQNYERRGERFVVLVKGVTSGSRT